MGIERTLAWLTSYRRLARDYERQPAVCEALIRSAAINRMIRRLIRSDRDPDCWSRRLSDRSGRMIADLESV